MTMSDMAFSLCARRVAGRGTAGAVSDATELLRRRRVRRWSRQRLYWQIGRYRQEMKVRGDQAENDDDRENGRDHDDERRGQHGSRRRRMRKRRTHARSLPPASIEV